jgi:hypothetical protein
MALPEQKFERDDRFSRSVSQSVSDACWSQGHNINYGPMFLATSGVQAGISACRVARSSWYNIWYLSHGWIVH